MEPTPAPQPQTPPAPTPPVVTPGVPVGWGVPSSDSLPDDNAGRKRIALIILIVLLITAGGIAVWTFGPWSNHSTPGGTAPASATLPQIESQLQNINSLVDDIDANMVGIDPGLSDTQGNLTE